MVTNEQAVAVEPGTVTMPATAPEDSMQHVHVDDVVVEAEQETKITPSAPVIDEGNVDIEAVPLPESSAKQAIIASEDNAAPGDQPQHEPTDVSAMIEATEGHQTEPQSNQQDANPPSDQPNESVEVSPTTSSETLIIPVPTNVVPGLVEAEPIMTSEDLDTMDAAVQESSTLTIEEVVPLTDSPSITATVPEPEQTRAGVLEEDAPAILENAPEPKSEPQPVAVSEDPITFESTPQSAPGTVPETETLPQAIEANDSAMEVDIANQVVHEAMPAMSDGIQIAEITPNEEALSTEAEPPTNLDVSTNDISMIVPDETVTPFATDAMPTLPTTKATAVIPKKKPVPETVAADDAGKRHREPFDRDSRDRNRGKRTRGERRRSIRGGRGDRRDRPRERGPRFEDEYPPQKKRRDDMPDDDYTGYAVIIILLGSAQRRYAEFCCDEIRHSGFSCAIRYLDRQPLSVALGRAARNGVSYIVILGKDNELNRTVSFKLVSQHDKRQSVVMTLRSAIKTMMDQDESLPPSRRVLGRPGPGPRSRSPARARSPGPPPRQRPGPYHSPPPRQRRYNYEQGPPAVPAPSHMSADPYGYEPDRRRGGYPPAPLPPQHQHPHSQREPMYMSSQSASGPRPAPGRGRSAPGPAPREYDYYGYSADRSAVSDYYSRPGPGDRAPAPMPMSMPPAPAHQHPSEYGRHQQHHSPRRSQYPAYPPSHMGAAPGLPASAAKSEVDAISNLLSFFDDPRSVASGGYRDAYDVAAPSYEYREDPRARQHMPGNMPDQPRYGYR